MPVSILLTHKEKQFCYFENFVTFKQHVDNFIHNIDNFKQHVDNFELFLVVQCSVENVPTCIFLPIKL